MKIKEKIKISDITGWTGSVMVSGSDTGWISSLSTDSRTIGKGDFFIPLKGDNFDGHDYIGAAIRSEASGLVYEKGRKDEVQAALQKSGIGKLAVFEAEDSLKFLMGMAGGYIRQFNPVAIGITGSLGKTAVKNYMASVLSRGFDTVATPGNFNTEIGISMTIFNIGKDTDYFIAEMGMRGAGQIRTLAEICGIRIAAITSISGSHMDFFDSIEDLARAKAEIAEPIKPGRGKLFLNADDVMTPFIKSIVESDVIEFGEDKGTDYNFINKDHDKLGRYSFNFLKGKEELGLIKCERPGYHNMYNGCLAAAICHYLGVDMDMIRDGIESAETGEHRMQVIECGTITVLDDCYNASPVSVEGALDVLCLISKKSGRRSVAVLGDMLELGSSAAELHYRTGAYAAKKDIDVLTTSGKLAKNIYTGFNESSGKSRTCCAFDGKDELLDSISGIVKAGDIVLVKGSRANRMEDIVHLIERIGKSDSHEKE